jgi:hypothetical protein
MIKAIIIGAAAAAAIGLAPTATASPLHEISCGAQSESPSGWTMAGWRHDRDRFRHDRHEAEGKAHRAGHKSHGGSHHPKSHKAEEARVFHGPHAGRDLREGGEAERQLHREHKSHKGQPQCEGRGGNAEQSGRHVRHDVHRGEGEAKHLTHRGEGRMHHLEHELEHGHI